MSTNKTAGKAGDVRIIDFIHPDSINVRVYDVLVLTLVTGKYSKPGELQWLSQTSEPISCKKEAEKLAAKMQSLT
jgi:hypothetical protein